MNNQDTSQLVGKEFFYFKYKYIDTVTRGKCVRIVGDIAIMSEGIFGNQYSKIPVNELIPVDPNEEYPVFDNQEPAKDSSGDFGTFVAVLIGLVLGAILVLIVTY